ncbi:MAG: hypothetical protein GXO91_03700, partial [FCB group bacterium]|nr:hypothetical protein [FCB group bacterium]
DYHFERLVELYGEMTGTINSALVLLRITDPEFTTPVAEDSVVGSGIALMIGFPFLYILNVPFVHFQNSITGYWVTLILIVAYWALLLLIWYSTGYFQFQKNDGKVTSL